MKTLKQRVREYLEAQQPYYGDYEVDDNLEVLEIQNDDLSNMGPLSKMLILRLIDDDELFVTIESAFIDKKLKNHLTKNTEL